MPPEIRIRPSDHAYDPQVFGVRVARTAAEVEHGGDPVRATGKLWHDYRNLDPINTIGTSEAPTLASLHASFGRIATVAELADATPKRARRMLPFSPGPFAVEARIDQALVAARMPSIPNAVVAATLHNIDATIQERSERKKARDGHYGLDFEALTTRSMMLYLDAKEIEESKAAGKPRPGSEAILRASLGGLILDSVRTMEHMHQDYAARLERGASGDAVSGHLLEAMYFSYRLLGLYESGANLAHNYVRFASKREDQPLVTSPVRRNFDVVAGSDKKSSPELVQVKSWLAQHPYDSAIDIWRPQYKGIVDESGVILEAFKTIVDNEAPDNEIMAARRELAARFGELPA